MNRVLIISMDKIDKNMAGSGIRNWEIAHQLAKHCQVTLTTPYSTDLESSHVSILRIDFENEDLRPLAHQADVIILQGTVLYHHPYLSDFQIPIAVDSYAPWLLENLVWHDQDDWQTWLPAYEKMFSVQLKLLEAGDFFFCASERQRDYWLGMLHAQNRINPYSYRKDPTLRNLIDVVSYGLPDKAPVATQPTIKGVHPAIKKTDKVILWSGGLWEWLDPLTLVHAVAKLVSRHPELKLYFMGTQHPNPAVVGMAMPAKTIALSQELGVYESHVFFNDWVPYKERANYLVEADLAVISHPEHIETRFSYRTRMLDCIWASIPLIITKGDEMADWVDKYNLGLTVPSQDVDAMAAAIEKILTRGEQEAYTAGFNSLRAKLSWSQVCEPLVNFCTNPSLASDRQYIDQSEKLVRGKVTEASPLQGTSDRHRTSLPFRLYSSIKQSIKKYL